MGVEGVLRELATREKQEAGRGLRSWSPLLTFSIARVYWPGLPIRARTHHMKEHRHPHPYRRLGLMIGLSFGAMYILMYAMVDSFGHVYTNVNQFYMAAL